MLKKTIAQPEIMKNKTPSCHNRCSACVWEYNDFHSPIWITAFRNGDKHHYGTRFLVSPAHQRNFEGLLDSLTKRLEPPFGAVRQVYSPCSGNTVKCLKDLKPNHKYVAAGKESLRKMKSGYLTYDEKFKKRHKCKHKKVEIYKPENGKALRDRYSSVQSKYLEDAERRRRGTIIIFVHRNGDFDNRAIRFVLSEKDRTSLYWWGPTMQSVASKLQMSSIKGFFTINGQAVHIPCHLQHGETYIAVSRMEKFQKGPYRRTEVTPHKLHNKNKCLGLLSICSSDSECEQIESSSEEEEGKEGTRGRIISQQSLKKQSNFEIWRNDNGEIENSEYKEGKMKPAYIKINHFIMKKVDSNHGHRCSDQEQVPTSRQQCHSYQECPEGMFCLDNTTEATLIPEHVLDCKTKRSSFTIGEREENHVGISSGEVMRPIYIKEIHTDKINMHPVDEKPDKKKELQSRAGSCFSIPLCHNSSTSKNHNNTNENKSFTNPKSESDSLFQAVEINNSNRSNDHKNNEVENNMSMEKNFQEVREEKENEVQIPCDIEKIVAHSYHGLTEPKNRSSHLSIVHYSTTIVFQKENESNESSIENKLSEELLFSQSSSLGEETQANLDPRSHAVVSCCDCYLMNNQEESLTTCNHTKKVKSMKKAKSQTDHECRVFEMVQLTRIPSKDFEKVDEIKSTRTSFSLQSQRDELPVHHMEFMTETCHKDFTNKKLSSKDNDEGSKEGKGRDKNKSPCCSCFSSSKRENSLVRIMDTSTKTNLRENLDENIMKLSLKEESLEQKRRRKTKRACCGCFSSSKRGNSLVGVKDASTETNQMDSLNEMVRKSSLNEAEIQTEVNYEESKLRKRRRKCKRSCCACFPLSQREDSTLSVLDASTEANVMNSSDETARKLSFKEAEIQTEVNYEESKLKKRIRKCNSPCCSYFPFSQTKGSSASVMDASTEVNLMDDSNKTANKISVREAESQTNDDYNRNQERVVKVEEEELMTDFSSDEEDEENMPEVSDRKIVSWYTFQNEKIYMRKILGINSLIFLYKYQAKTPQNRRLCTAIQEARRKNNKEFLFGIKNNRKSRSSVKKKCKKFHQKNGRSGKIISRPCARWDWGKRPRGRLSLQKNEPSLSVPYDIGYVRSSGKNPDHLIFENPHQNTDKFMNFVIAEAFKYDIGSETSKENKSEGKRGKPIPLIKTPQVDGHKKRGNYKRTLAKNTQTKRNDKNLEEEYLKEKFEPYSGDESDSKQISL